ncbi:MAG TPA: guanine deaminase, partial [Corynebacterium nuruki]|nr:guanine deaminase [Corynebacterium nuruki]
VSRLLGSPLSVAELLRLSTLGGAEALGVEDSVGSLEVGKDADLVVL